MGQVTIIPAKIQKGNLATKTEIKKLRVAAYCRVSTDTEEQESSYTTQVEHYTDYINKNPEWELAGIYADDGISGTNTKKREEFNRMIEDCMDGNIDQIITKSISRFARNTLDCLKYIRLLKEKNIPVYFEKENINTCDSKGEVLLTIMASLAQQESQSLSQNVKLGLQYRYQQGKVQVNHKRFLGYTKDSEGNLIIDPIEAEVIKRIYREFLDGKGATRIARGLEKDGILTGAGNKRWHPSTVDKILRNEKYMGDALLQKTVTTDFLTKTRVKNNGIAQQYYVENAHEAIIPKDIFLLVQEEISRRSHVHESPSGKKRVFSSSHVLAQKVYCAECGDLYRRIHWYTRGKKSIVWRCISRLENAGVVCHNHTIYEEDLKQTCVDAINQLVENKQDVLDQLSENLTKAITLSDALSPDAIQMRLDELQQRLIQSAQNKENYDILADEIYRLKEQKQAAQTSLAKQKETKKKIQTAIRFLQKQQPKITGFDEALVGRLIERISIEEGRIKVQFKSGLEIGE